jgi:hypothetical protein
MLRTFGLLKGDAVAGSGLPGDAFRAGSGRRPDAAAAWGDPPSEYPATGDDCKCKIPEGARAGRPRPNSRFHSRSNGDTIGPVGRDPPVSRPAGAQEDLMSQSIRAALLVLLAGGAGCTVVKPVVCTFTYPVAKMAASLSVPDDPSDDYAEIPAPLVCVAAPVLIPLRFVGLAAMGFGGGLVSGFASDLNVVLWRFEAPWTNLSRPFLTNARKPERE